MGGLSAVGTGRFEIVIEQGKKAVATTPDVVHGYGSVTIGTFSLDRFGEAEDSLRLASARKLEPPLFRVYRYIIAFLKGDQTQMDQTVAQAKGKHGFEHWITHSQAMVMARSGRLREARALSSRAMDLAKQEGTLETVATYQAAAAVSKYEEICAISPGLKAGCCCSKYSARRATVVTSTSRSFCSRWISQFPMKTSRGLTV